VLDYEPIVAWTGETGTLVWRAYGVQNSYGTSCALSLENQSVCQTAWLFHTLGVSLKGNGFQRGIFPPLHALLFLSSEKESCN